MRKGLFWVIPDNDGEQRLLSFTAVCDSNGIAVEGQPAYNSKKGNSFAHERTWASAAENLPAKIRCKAWNFFPRGRVEIAKGIVTVYYNPTISEWTEFEDSIRNEFELDGHLLRFVPDYSKHYNAHLKEDLL